MYLPTTRNVVFFISTFWGILFVGVRVLIEGQPILDYTGPDGYRAFSCTIMLLLLASTCLVMLNIFIAQLSTCYDSETKLAKRSFQSHLAATIARYERGEDLTSFGCFRYSRIKHFKEKVSILESLDEKSNSFGHRLRQWCRCLKRFVPCWIYRKKCIRVPDEFSNWSDDENDIVSDCESTCKELCSCKPKWSRKARKGMQKASADDNGSDVTVIQYSSDFESDEETAAGGLDI